jgi:excinuclease UvrABC nuclease subunit
MSPLDYDYRSICKTNTVPTSGGVYIFSEKGAPLGQYLYAGKSGNLRDRIGNQHGSVKESCDMLGMVMRERKRDAEEAKSWMSENCRVQWVEVEPKRLRAFVEDYTIAVLRPIWNHKKSRDVLVVEHAPALCLPL